MAFQWRIPLLMNKRKTEQTAVVWDRMRIPDAGNIQWRHEWKYMLSAPEAAAIRARVKAVMELDPHAKETGKYWIRSLYFDNDRDTALREKLDGTDPREKFRIRYYNHDPSLLYLEKKYKRGGLGTKFSEEISPQTVWRILDGTADWFPENADAGEDGAYEAPLLLELYSKMRFSGLRPKNIVDYVREPYQFEAGNVRITFDYQLRTSWNPEGFLDPDSDTIPADYPLRMTDDVFYSLAHQWKAWQPKKTAKFEKAAHPEKIVQSEKAMHPEKIVQSERVVKMRDYFSMGRPFLLLEVKWDHFLPEIIQDIIRTSLLPNSAFSKYAQSRSFP